MTDLDINAFWEEDETGITGFLVLADDDEFNVLLPREMIDPRDFDEFTGFLPFTYAAYAAEILAPLADDFSYMVPCRHTTDPVELQFTVIDKPAFAKALVNVIKNYKAFYAHGDDDEWDVHSVNLAYEVYECGRECYAPGLIFEAFLVNADEEREKAVGPIVRKNT